MAATPWQHMYAHVRPSSTTTPRRAAYLHGEPLKHVVKAQFVSSARQALLQDLERLHLPLLLSYADRVLSANLHPPIRWAATSRTHTRERSRQHSTTRGG